MRFSYNGIKCKTLAVLMLIAIFELGMIAISHRNARKVKDVLFT